MIASFLEKVRKGWKNYRNVRKVDYFTGNLK